MIFTEYSSKTLAATISQMGHDSLLSNILVPVDFSDCADNAIRFAVAIALRTGAKLTLFHSVHLPLQTGEMVAYAVNELEREAAKQLGDKAEEITNWLEKERFRQLEVRHLVQVGFAADQVVLLAEDAHSDLVVMGTHGAGALEGRLLGSNASAVMRRLKCPVLVVPQDAEFAGFKRILYGTDMQEINRPALKLLADFAGHFDAELHVLHVLTEGEKLGPEQANSFKDQFQKAVHYPKLGFHIVDAEADTISEVVDEFVTRHNIELVAMLTHQRGFFDQLFHPSLTKKIAVQARGPLLAFH
jgi:nucleotide-binding universal stress UspA family protein